MNKQGNILLPLVSVFAIVAAIAAGYFYSQLDDERAASGAYDKSLPPITVTPTKVDETANWKTYKDPHGIFEVKHPDSLKAEPKIVVPNMPGAHQPTQAEKEMFSGVFYNNIPDGNTSKPGEMHVTFYNYKIKQKTSENIKDFIFRITNYSFNDIKEITVDGQKSYRSNLVEWVGGGVGELGAFIPNGKDTYVLVLLDSYEAGSPGGISKENINLFDQILSTFKFL